MLSSRYQSERIKMSHQVIALNSQNECPICMETLEGLCNRVVTECGHAFHCSCLMQNAAHNGFGCPYCRSKLAEEPEEEEYDDEDDNSLEEDTVIFGDDALTSFRMFHQQINGEEVEEEDAEEWESTSSSSEEEDTIEMPDAVYMAHKLEARGVTFVDLIKNILYQEHSTFGEHYSEYERICHEVYGKFRAVISQYRPNSSEELPVQEWVFHRVGSVAHVTPVEPPIVPPIVPLDVPAVVPPVVAEAKTVSVVASRRREFMTHA